MELLDIVNCHNQPTGRIVDRETAHKRGLRHREVVAWIMNLKGEVLLEQRALTKQHSPGKWSPCAGHVDSGEEMLPAMLRELAEELGVVVRPEQLELLFSCADKPPHMSSGIKSPSQILTKSAHICTF